MREHSIAVGLVPTVVETHDHKKSSEGGNASWETLLRRSIRWAYGLTAESWLIGRWLFLKAVSLVAYAVFGRKENTERWVISVGNKLFPPSYSTDLFTSYQSYCEQMHSDLSEYFTLYPRGQWLDNKVVLDLGSGLGQYSELLQRHGASRVVAMEYQGDKSAWSAERLIAAGVEPMVGSAEALPFPEGTFDSVFSHTVFEHIGNVELALSNVYRVLKPGGVALLSYNFFHHRGGHHLFPYIHFPWAPWVVSEQRLCDYWSDRLLADQASGGMGFYPQGARVRSLTEGAEIHLNKHNFDEFEAMIARSGLTVVRRRSSENWARTLPFLQRIPKLKYFMAGTIYYVLSRPEQES